MLFIFPLITFIRYISLRGELIGKAICLLVQIMFKYFFILLKKTDYSNYYKLQKVTSFPFLELKLTFREKKNSKAR